MLARRPSPILRAALSLLALALATTGCGSDEGGPLAETTDGPLGVAEGAVLVCADGSAAYYPCYHDNDDDGRGSGAAYYACNCGTAAGTSRTNNDCNDSNAQRYQWKSCYVDADDDDVGTGSASSVCVGATCESRAGYATEGGDCDDGDAARYQMLTCYVDADGDHYGASSSSSSSRCMGATCASPAGYAESRGDCDDGDATRRPYASEVVGNQFDDDCDGLVDNAAVVFYSTGYGNTSSSFKIRAKLNGAAEVTAAAAAIASGGTLYAKVHYRKLSEGSLGDLSYPSTLLSYATATVSSAGSSYYVEVTLPGLEAATVYRAALALYSGSGLYKTRILAGDGTTNDNTNTYYTMTEYAAGSDGPVHTARQQIVLKALYEYYYFHTHTMGSWDDSLRDRYDLAARDTAYCTEFYANAGKSFLVDLNPCEYDATSRPWCDPAETSDRESNLSALQTWFTDPRWVGSTPFALNDGVMSARKPGDWIGVNPDSDTSPGVHTQMFLAWDAAAGDYWYVEGNGSASYGYGTIQHTVNVGSHDQCDNSGARFYCPATASSFCPTVDGKACFYVKSTGSINNSNMLD